MSVHAAAAPGLLQIPPLAGRRGAGRRHLLSILDLSPAEAAYLCRRALAIKHAESDPQTLRGRTVGVYFRGRDTEWARRSWPPPAR